MNIGLLLDMAADTFGDRIAVGARDGGLTYVHLRERARTVAAAVATRPVSRLVLAAESSADLPSLLFGSAYAGIPFTALNYRLADDRLRRAVERSTPALVVADDRTRPRVAGVVDAEVVTSAVLVADGPNDLSLPVGDATGESVAVSLFTSGTTGEPKSVLLRHRNLFAYIVGTNEFGGADPDDAALVSVPPYHIAGLAAVLSNTYLGRRIVYLPQFDPAAWVELAAGERITHAMIVPTMLARILDVLEETGTALPALKHLSYGGGRMPLPTIQRALELLPHVDFVNAYGLTETSSTISILGPEDHRTAAAATDPEAAARLGSVGCALPGVEIVVRDPDGHRCEPDVVGEVWVRGDQVSGEYLGRPSLDGEGWFRTNDLGRLDADGFLFLEGRADDVIVRGGENLSPGEIEDVLLEHPAVAEVAVVGRPDPEWGECPVAFVVPCEGREIDDGEVRGWVRSRLRSSRVPSLVVVRAALPYSDTGKLLRRQLRAEAALLP